MFRDLFILAASIAITFSSCSKKTTDTGYTGKWELRKIEGGFTGHHEYAPGNGNLNILTSDSLTQLVNNIIVYTHTYTIVKDSCYYFVKPQLMDKLIYTDPNMNSVSVFLERKGRILYQYSGNAADGTAMTYEKID